MRRSAGRAALAVLFALLALNALAQVALVPLGRSDDPPALIVFQALIGASGMAAAWGSWVGARWAALAALLYGAVTAGMLIALVPLIKLGPGEREGVWFGAAAIFALALASAWYLRRSAKPIEMGR
jgi:hypothetical protein